MLVFLNGFRAESKQATCRKTTAPDRFQEYNTSAKLMRPELKPTSLDVGRQSNFASVIALYAPQHNAQPPSKRCLSH